MSLKEKLKNAQGSASDPRKAIFEKYGLMENPYPASGQPSGHPRLDDTAADDAIVLAIKQFEREHKTQVLVVEGTQGIGKTNLLNYYQQELQDYFREDNTFYIIRYYPDPEPTFDAIVRRVFQELGPAHLVRIGKAISVMEDDDVEVLFTNCRSHEVRVVLLKVRAAAQKGEEELATIADTVIDWLLGLRLLKVHKDTLGVKFRLDTVESKTQALRDIVVVSEELGLLKGIFLLLDELEKQDYSLTKTPVLRYLSAIRALIDALPKRLFLVLAITPEARRRYFSMLPAIAGRLANRIVLSPLKRKEEAIAIARFYEENARERAKQAKETKAWKAGRATLLSTEVISDLFAKAHKHAADRGVEGVVHRDFLNRLRTAAETAIAELE